MSAARDAAEEYDRRSARVVAVNPGSLESHQEWTKSFKFGFPICVDEGKQVAQAYDVISLTGGISRTVFVIDAEGQIAWAWAGMPETSEILSAIDSLSH